MLRTKSEERYMHDVNFHAVVDQLRANLFNELIDIASLIEAAVLAANLHAMERGVGTVVLLEHPHT